MNKVLVKFQELALKASAGDTDAENEFFAEAAKLFPADFGKARSDLSNELADQLERALAIIRQNVTTGG